VGAGHAQEQLVAEAVDLDAESFERGDGVPAELAGVGEVGAGGELGWVVAVGELDGRAVCSQDAPTDDGECVGGDVESLGDVGGGGDGSDFRDLLRGGEALALPVGPPCRALAVGVDGQVRAWAPRVDTNGEVLWRVQLVALGDGEAEIIRVAVPGDPGVAQGEMMRVEGLTGQAWEKDGRSGMAFRATAVRSVSARAEKAAA